VTLTATNLQGGYAERPTTERTPRGHRHAQSFVDVPATGKGIDEIKPAGRYQVDSKGAPILAAKLSNVPEIIKVDNPALPIKDRNTTYNTVHNKEGYPYHYAPQRASLSPVKLTQIEEKVTPGKRHPHEVKSSIESSQRSRFMINPRL
jgi:hypothetical protein